VEIPIHFHLDFYTQVDGAIVGKEVPPVGAKRLQVTLTSINPATTDPKLVAMDPVAAKSSFLCMYMSNHKDTLASYVIYHGKVANTKITNAEMTKIDSKVPIHSRAFCTPRRLNTLSM
jgi:hypothetical protein